MVFALETAWVGVLAAYMCWLVWQNHTSGRIAHIGPERRSAPISFWVVQILLGSFALFQVAHLLLRLWAVGLLAYRDG